LRSAAVKSLLVRIAIVAAFAGIASSQPARGGIEAIQIRRIST
jgi:hypothetical protein